MPDVCERIEVREYMSSLLPSDDVRNGDNTLRLLTDFRGVAERGGKSNSSLAVDFVRARLGSGDVLIRGSRVRCRDLRTASEPCWCLRSLYSRARLQATMW